MSDWSVDTASELARARLEGRTADVASVTAPSNLDEAEVVRDRGAEIICRSLGTECAGWKIGCTSRSAMVALGAEEPFAGALFKPWIWDDGASVPVRSDGTNVAEPEFAFLMAKPLSSRPEPYMADEVAAAVKSVHPAIEVVDPRVPNGFQAPLPWLVADGGVSHAFVWAAGSADWTATELAEQEVVLRRNGAVVGHGRGAAAYGGPILALTWLSNHLSARGKALSAGDVVTTGLVTEIVSGGPGDRFEADFGKFGKVSLSLAART